MSSDTPFKLYYDPMLSGSANYIVASLGGLEFESEQVKNVLSGPKVTASGEDYITVNPKGNVPCIVFDDGRPILNENSATLTFLGDQNMETGLTPAEGTQRRYDYYNALGFVQSELHPNLRALANPAMTEDERKKAMEVAGNSVQRFIDLILAGKDYCLEGDKPVTADIYAYVLLSLAPVLNVDLDPFPTIKEYIERVGKTPGIEEAKAKIKAATEN